ncbi:MAG: hypothetical protein IPP36_08630 [Nitrosomonadales bacterium]|nr:hypothetical protein [Nitrosomonadales bacterium]
MTGTSLSNLDMDRLSYYLSGIIRDPEIPSADAEWEERLLGLGLMASDGLGNTVCSVAGVVCFGINLGVFFWQAGLRVMAFSGTTKNIRQHWMLY